MSSSIRTAIAALPLAVYPAAAAVSFHRDIWPMMSNTCFQCHGPGKSSRMAASARARNFRLTDVDGRVVRDIHA